MSQPNNILSPLSSQGITAVLTLSTIALDSRTGLPKVHYATALDWFIICSFLYCLASILEFAGVHYFTKVAFTTITIDTNFLRLEVGNPLETTAWS